MMNRKIWNAGSTAAAVIMFSAVMAACSGSSGGSDAGDVQGADNSVGDTSSSDAAFDVGGNDLAGNDVPGSDVTEPKPRRYAGSASHGDLVVFSVDPAAGKCEVVNETTGQTSTVDYTVMEGDLAGVLHIQSGGDSFYAVELTDKLIAANFDTGNPANTISFGVSGGTDNAANIANLPGDYVYIGISNKQVNGSSDIKEWGVLSIIDDGTFRVKVQASDVGTETTAQAMAPEMWSGEFPVANPDITGTWAVDADDPVRIDVVMNGVPGNFTGFAYAPDPNAVFVLDLGEGSGFILALKILPGMTMSNLQGTYKFVNVWNDSMGAGRSAGKAVINGNGTGTFGTIDTEGLYSSGTFDSIAACPAFPNMFHATSTESGHGATVTLKHYFVLLPYAFAGFNFRTDGGFVFAGYSVGARID